MSDKRMANNTVKPIRNMYTYKCTCTILYMYMNIGYMYSLLHDLVLNISL